MPDVTIRRTWKVEGVLTNATSVKLSDPTSTFGVKRNDTDATVVADDTAMTNASTGVYEYSFTALTGVAYTAYIEIVYAGATYYFEDDIAAFGSLSSTAYATPSDMMERYDLRLLGDMVSDDNTQVNEAALGANTNLLEALEDAAGAIEVALRTGGRYTPAQLAALTGNSLQHLKRVNCDIALAYLLQRRVDMNPERAEAQMKLAERYLTKLQQGINVFGIDDVLDASTVSFEQVTSVDLRNANTMRDRTRNYYPIRRLPRNG